MPNWCNNTIQITADKATIKRIEQSLNSEDDDAGFLNVLYPMPKALQNTTKGPEASEAEEKQRSAELIKECGFDNWYDWRVEHWGTKWNVNESYGTAKISNDGQTIEFGFDTAWSPPTGAYHNFLSKNPKASLFATYYEGGCDFMGVWDNGDDRHYEPSQYDSSSTFWTDDEDGGLLDENFCLVESITEQEENQAQDEDVTRFVNGEAVNIGKQA
jgi:hypothetical protein